MRLADVFALQSHSTPEGTVQRGTQTFACELGRIVRAAARDERTSRTGSSPRGKLQFDLWGVAPSGLWIGRPFALESQLTSSHRCSSPHADGIRQILGNNECFEPFTSNMYVRRVLAGEYIVVNKHLVRTLETHGLWTEEIRQSIIAGNGSVQHVSDIPDSLRRVFRTVWEIPMRSVIDMAADRAPFVDQSMSLNLFKDPTRRVLTSMHFHAWKRGCRRMYYLRTRAATDPLLRYPWTSAAETRMQVARPARPE